MQPGEEMKMADFVKVATSITLQVSLASSVDSKASAGRILPPYIDVEYQTLTYQENYEKNTPVALSFQIIYHANVSQVRMLYYAPQMHTHELKWNHTVIDNF